MGSRPAFRKLMKWESFLFVLLILEIIIFGAMNPKFLQLKVIFGSINDYISICIIALFVTFVLITGGMDIQAGSIVGLSSIVVGLLWQDYHINIWVACVFALIIGGLCGLFSGFFVAYFQVQPMVITLGGSFLYSGLAIALTNLSSTESYQGISGFPTSFTDFTKYRLFGIPSQFYLFIFLMLIAYLLLHRSKYGRKVFLCGVNQNAADYSGISSKLIVMSTYALSGISAAIAGIAMTSYLGTAKADFGKELTLPIITAVVLGGTANTGGKGSILGTALASLVIGLMRFGLNMGGISTQYLDIPVGILLILAVAFRFFGNHPVFIRLMKKISKCKKRMQVKL